MEITEKSRIEQLLQQYPGISKVFKKRHMDCLSCRGLVEDTVGQIARNNGLNVKEFVGELKKAAESRS